MTEPVDLDELDRWEALLLSEYKAAEEEDREGYLENWDEWRVVYTAGEEIRHLRAEVKRLRGLLARIRDAGEQMVLPPEPNEKDPSFPIRIPRSLWLEAAKAVGGEHDA